MATGTDAAADSTAAAPPTAVVVGGGISGLLAARQLARAGVRTTVLEASGDWGGCVGSHVVAGLTLDSGAESFATRSTAVAGLAEELGLGAQIVQPNPGGAWVQLPEGPRELPKTGVLGIPANPWDPEVRRSLGLVGSLRASVDALLPASVGTAAEATSVAALVRLRMGRRVLDRLVSPVVGGVHSADPACRKQAPPSPAFAAACTPSSRPSSRSCARWTPPCSAGPAPTRCGASRAAGASPPEATLSRPNGWSWRWRARPPSSCSPARCPPWPPSAPRPAP